MHVYSKNYHATASIVSWHHNDITGMSYYEFMTFNGNLQRRECEIVESSFKILRKSRQDFIKNFFILSDRIRRK